GGEPAPGRRPGSRGDRLLPFKPGLPQVDVQVDQSGQNQPTPEIDHFASGSGKVAAHRRDAAAFHPDVRIGEIARGRIQKATVFEEHRFHPLSPPPIAHSSTAIRTGTPQAICSEILERGCSTSSSAISTPRLTGPGCMMTAWGCMRAKRSIVNP